MKFSEYINEERIHSQDKRAIISFIKHPKDDNYKTKNGEMIKVKKVNNGVNFSFDKENYELSMTIIDIIDALGGYKTSSKTGSITAILKGE